VSDLDVIREQYKKYVEHEIKNTKPTKVENISFPSPIFMGGCGSSGTTLLRSMLGVHKNIACGEEAVLFDWPKIYKTPVSKLHQMFLEQDFSELDGDRMYPIQLGKGEPYFGLNLSIIKRNNYHDVATINDLLKNSNDVKQFFDLFFSNYAKNHDKKRWAEKSPNNVFCIEEIFSLYPDAKFIHVIRDGRDVVLSLIQKRHYSLVGAIYRWLISVEAGLRFRGNPRYYEVKYEDLVLDTEKTLHGLTDFIDEEFDPKMLEYWGESENNFLGYGSQPVFSSSIGKWRDNKLDSSLLRTLDLMLRDKLTKIGYE